MFLEDSLPPCSSFAKEVSETRQNSQRNVHYLSRISVDPPIAPANFCTDWAASCAMTKADLVHFKYFPSPFVLFRLLALQRPLRRLAHQQSMKRCRCIWAGHCYQNAPVFRIIVIAQAAGRSHPGSLDLVRGKTACPIQSVIFVSTTNNSLCDRRSTDITANAIR